MTQSKFDRLQMFFFNALDRMGATYEILEMGDFPNNFYLKVDIDGDEYELSECDRVDDSSDCKCCKDDPKHLTSSQIITNNTHTRY